MNRFEAIFLIEIFNYVGFSLKNEVEHDFSEGLSSLVFLKFSRPLPNLTRIGNPSDLANDLATAKSYGFPIRVKLGGGRANFEITLVERPSKKSCSTSFFKKNPT